MKSIKFERIDGEIQRTYTFVKDGHVVDVTIDYPVLLNVSPSGGHRVIDANDISHYIPSGWIRLYWETKPGQHRYPL